MKHLIFFHALCGALALILLPIPLISKKGGKIHIQTGWAYTILMILVATTAYVITPWRAFIDPERTTATQSFAFFLFFVSNLTIVSLWYGMIVLRYKNRKESSHDLKHIGPPILLILITLGIMAQGIKTNSSLLTAFPILGFFISKGQLEYWLRPPRENKHWWFAHMDGMISACIATITAFLVTAVPRLTDASLFRSPILWITPGVVLGILARCWKAKYRQQFSG